MSFLARLFGSDTIINKAADGIDKAWFTDQEKASQFAGFLKLYEPFKLAQRLLALTFGLPYVFTWLICVGIFVASLFFEPCLTEVCKHTQMSAAAKDLAEWNNEVLGTPVSLIMAFYFGGGMLEGAIGKFKSK